MGWRVHEDLAAGGLLTARRAADYLGCTKKTLIAEVEPDLRMRVDGEHGPSARFWRYQTLDAARPRITNTRPDDRPKKSTRITRPARRSIGRDPILDRVCQLIRESDLSVGQIALNSGIAERTLTSWLSGTTKRPLNLSIDQVLQALGYYRIVNTNKVRAVH